MKKLYKIKSAATVLKTLYKAVYNNTSGNPLEKISCANRSVAKIGYLSYVKPTIIRVEKWMER